jgi:superfamily II helicase
MEKLIKDHLAESISELKTRINEPPREVLEAYKVISEFKQKEDEWTKKLKNSKLPNVSPESCPDCFLEGNISHMVCIPSSDNTDRFACNKCDLELP